MPSVSPRDTNTTPSPTDRESDVPEESIRIEEIKAAHQRIAPYIHRTAVLRSGTLDDTFGRQLFFKC
jgi:hypothetical protein